MGSLFLWRRLHFTISPRIHRQATGLAADAVGGEGFISCLRCFGCLGGATYIFLHQACISQTKLWWARYLPFLVLVIKLSAVSATDLSGSNSGFASLRDVSGQTRSLFFVFVFCEHVSACRGSLSPVKAPVPLWGQTAYGLSDLSPKRESGLPQQNQPLVV